MTATEPNADVRRGLPSASALPRLSKCAASWLLGKEAARQGIVEPENQDAASGTRIHRWLETRGSDDWAALSEDEQKTAQMCADQEAAIIQGWTPDGAELAQWAEIRLWGNTGLLGVFAHPLDSEWSTLIFSGQSDRLLQTTRIDLSSPTVRALVIDFKSGRTEYEPAVGNAQLAGLAVLASLWTGARSVRVGLVQPWAGPPSVADFDGPALDEAKSQLLALLKHIEEPGLVPVVGKWCGFCPAKLICPAMARSLDYLVQPPGLATIISGGQLAEELRIWKFVEKYGAALQAEAKRRLESNSPDAPEGWCLTDGRKTRTITNLAEAFGILNAEFGITHERMTAACKASLPEIEADVAKHGGISKTQAVKEVADALGGLIEYGKTAPSLAEKKPERAQIAEGASA